VTRGQRTELSGAAAYFFILMPFSVL